MLQGMNQAAQQAQQSQQRAQQMSGLGQQSGGFAGVQNIMQPGFAGTDGQQVRQEIARDLQNQSMMSSRGMSGSQQSAGFMPQAGFGGAQSSMQGGFDGAQSSMQSGFGGGQYGMQAGFGGAQNIMQPGFAGTDGQQVRQEIARDLQNQSMMNSRGMSGSQQSTGFMPQAGFGGAQSSFQAGLGGGQSGMQSGFGGAQNIMQPGFAGTDGQQVQQQIARGLQNQSMMNSGGMSGSQMSAGFMPQAGFGGAQSSMMSGFDGGQSSMQGGFGGAQNIMQPGAAGTDGQQVRQEIARDLQNQSMMNSGSMGGSQQSAGFMPQAGFGGGQSSMQSGFGGGQSSMQSGFGGGQSSMQTDGGQSSMQTDGGQSSMQTGFGGAQNIMQPGAAGTDAQQVRQEIARDLQNQSMMNSGGMSGSQFTQQAGLGGTAGNSMMSGASGSMGFMQ